MLLELPDGSLFEARILLLGVCSRSLPSICGCKFLPASDLSMSGKCTRPQGRSTPLTGVDVTLMECGAAGQQAFQVDGFLCRHAYTQILHTVTRSPCLKERSILICSEQGSTLTHPVVCNVVSCFQICNWEHLFDGFSICQQHGLTSKFWFRNPSHRALNRLSYMLMRATLQNSSQGAFDNC